MALATAAPSAFVARHGLAPASTSVDRGAHSCARRRNRPVARPVPESKHRPVRRSARCRAGSRAPRRFWLGSTTVPPLINRSNRSCASSLRAHANVVTVPPRASVAMRCRKSRRWRFMILPMREVRESLRGSRSRLGVTNRTPETILRSLESTRGRVRRLRLTARSDACAGEPSRPDGIPETPEVAR